MNPLRMVLTQARIPSYLVNNSKLCNPSAQTLSLRLFPPHPNCSLLHRLESLLLPPPWRAKMPRYFCDYCQTYLTHDSAPGRKQHNRGWKHRENVKMYYEQYLAAWEASRGEGAGGERGRHGGSGGARSPSIATELKKGKRRVLTPASLPPPRPPPRFRHARGR